MLIIVRAFQCKPCGFIYDENEENKAFIIYYVKQGAKAIIQLTPTAMQKKTK